MEGKQCVLPWEIPIDRLRMNKSKRQVISREIGKSANVVVTGYRPRRTEDKERDGLDEFKNQ